MKKYIIFSFMLCSASVIYAQETALDNGIVIKGSNEISKELTPKEIVDSLKKRFPNAEAVKYYKTPASTIEAGWNITSEDNIDQGSELDTYTISFKNHKFQYYALFDKNGNLLMEKHEETDAALPTAVVNAVKTLAQNDKYKDYKLLEKKYYKQENYGKKKEYFEIIGVNKTNSKDIKMITLAPDGTVLKES